MEGIEVLAEALEGVIGWLIGVVGLEREGVW